MRRDESRIKDRKALTRGLAAASSRSSWLRVRQGTPLALTPTAEPFNATGGNTLSRLGNLEVVLRVGGPRLRVSVKTAAFFNPLFNRVTEARIPPKPFGNGPLREN